jgi:hypothetical protein
LFGAAAGVPFGEIVSASLKEANLPVGRLRTIGRQTCFRAVRFVANKPLGVAKMVARHIGAGIFSMVSEVLNLFGYFSV